MKTKAGWMLALCASALLFGYGHARGGDKPFVQQFDLNDQIELQTLGRQKSDTLEMELKFTKAPRGGCTFGQVYLQDAKGRRIFPYRIKILERWAKLQVTLSWSKTKYVNGREVRHQEGSTSNCYSWLMDRKVSVEKKERDGETPMPDPIWERLGFRSPEGGARKIRTVFKLPEEETGKLTDWDVCVDAAHVEKKGLFRKEAVEVPAAFTLIYHEMPASPEEPEEKSPDGQKTGEKVTVAVPPEKKDEKKEPEEPQAEDVWREIELAQK